MRNYFTRTLFITILTGALGFSPLLRAMEVDFENDSNLPIVYINTAIRGGSVTDPIHQQGITNFMGEMLLRGTHSKSKKDLDLLLDSMGATLEVEVRAEALIVRGAVLSSQLDRYLDLVTEILTQPRFPEDQIKKLKSEIISGIQEDLGHDSGLAAHKFNQFLFQGHPYGRPPIGRTEDIQNLNKKLIEAHYAKLLNSPNILVVGSGDASTEKITTWANNLGSRLDSSSKSSPPQNFNLEIVKRPTDLKTKKLLVINKPYRTQTQIYIGQIGVRMTDKDFFPLYVGNHAFGGSSFSAILTEEIRVKRGWSYGAGSSFRQGLQPRSWTVHLYPASKDTTAALAYTLKLISDLKTNGLSPKQFNFAKTSLMNSSGFTYNTPKKRVENKLLEKTLNLPDGFIKSFGTEIEKINISATNLALNKFLKPKNLAITVLATAKDLKEGLIQASGVQAKDVTVVQFTQE